jgi:hypothetical protein
MSNEQISRIKNIKHCFLRVPITIWKSTDNYIILLFNSKYKRQWINVIFCRIKTTLMQYPKIKSLCVFGTKLRKDSVNFASIPVFKPHTHKLYILRHCTNIVNIAY